MDALAECPGGSELLQVKQHVCCRLAAPLDSLDEQLLYCVLQDLRELKDVVA